MIKIKFFGEGKDQSSIIDAKTFKFPGGELQTSINMNTDNFSSFNKQLDCVARLNSSDDIIELLLVNQIIDPYFHAYTMRLFIPYMPYGRQDRIMQENEAFSLKVITGLLNKLCFDKIITYDCHSPVTNALIDNLQEITQADIFAEYGSDEFIELIHKSILVAPDAGAAKKVQHIAKIYKRPLVIAEKIRDVSTGEIKGTKVDLSDVPLSMPILIIDDICDGGRTFIELAKAIGNINPIHLYVTHGIFSQGLDIFDGLIDRIYTTDTFKVQPEHPKLTTFKIIE